MNGKTYTRAELAEILEKHGKWLRDEDGGKRSDLSGANLSDANLRGANLRGANLSGANLRGTYLSNANLSGADLSGTNLRGACLRGANLSGADLSGTNLSGTNLSGAYLSGTNLSGTNLSGASSFWGTVGNCQQIKSIQADTWPVTYTATHMQIGCQLHTLKEWWSFGDEEIVRMASCALAWWRVWKPILRKVIETSPAKAG